MPQAAVSLACPIRPTNDPAANPYRIEFAFALGLLLGVFLVWRRLRPPPRRLLRFYAGAGGAVAFLVMQAQACVHFDSADRDFGCLLVVKAAVFVAASLLMELLLSSRQRSALSPAVAREKGGRWRLRSCCHVAATRDESSEDEPG